MPVSQTTVSFQAVCDLTGQDDVCSSRAKPADGTLEGPSATATSDVYALPWCTPVCWCQRMHLREVELQLLTVSTCFISSPLQI